jgi:hypothetical protein
MKQTLVKNAAKGIFVAMVISLFMFNNLVAQNSKTIGQGKEDQREKFKVAKGDELATDDNGGGGSHSCTVTRNCFGTLSTIVVATISCTGTECKIGHHPIWGYYVECNKNRTYC